MTSGLDIQVEHIEAGPGPTTVAAVAWEPGRKRSAGYAQAVRRPGAWTLEVVADHRRADEGVRTALVRAVLDAVAAEGGGTVNLWVPRPTNADDAMAQAAGIGHGRDLLQMRRPLPVGEPFTVKVRPFEPGRDEETWLEVNNRAFAKHPEQGAWDRETLDAHIAEVWFDPQGFLLHERDGRLAGFCWTKVHPDERPPLGEIFVIAVDPDFEGLGLGRELTLAGLDHLANHGVPVGMLYVDASNARAQRLYEQLGFTVDHVHRAYTTIVPNTVS